MAAGMFVVALGVRASSENVPVPRLWSDKELSGWALPIAGLNLVPGHYSEREYYAAPVENLRSYPVYHPDREPPGYWERLQRTAPEPLIDTSTRRTDAEWIDAGQRVFRELDVPGFRSADPGLITRARSREALAEAGVVPRASGVIFGLRWIPTAQGVRLGISDCAGCHTRHLDDGRIVDGAPFNHPDNDINRELIGRGVSFFFSGDTPAMAAYRQFGVPWLNGDVHEALPKMPLPQIGALFAELIPGMFARANGSPYFPTKVPDLIGLQHRRYLNHTGTHRQRGIGDAMRYGALVAYADSLDFGSHAFWTPEQRRMRYRVPDEAFYAIVRYLYALEPPANPNKADERSAAGAQISERERCGRCHTPPLYTNNKLTPVNGFTPPPDHPAALDIADVRVGTDPALALRTRKGTGFYKVPSLRGVWYRGLFLHDGSIARLEEMFDRARLRDDYLPSGFRGDGGRPRRVPGHEFGIDLSPDERAKLVAFLRTL